MEEDRTEPNEVLPGELRIPSRTSVQLSKEERRERDVVDASGSTQRNVGGNARAWGGSQGEP